MFKIVVIGLISVLVALLSYVISAVLQEDRK